MSLRSVWSNITRGETWLRGVVMLLFVVIYGVTEVLLAAVVLLQFLFTLVTGDQNGRLREFGYSISVFVYQMVRYWTYNSEEKPFPFNPWPGAGK